MSHSDAAQYANRNRGTGDWYRHDDKNVEEPQAPPTRLPDKRGEEYAEKNKGEPEQWFQHNPENPTDPPPQPHLPSAEAHHVQEKIHGIQEVWFKHDENQDYYSDRPANLPADGPSRSFKDKFTTSQSNDWYKYDEKTQEVAAPADPELARPSDAKVQAEEYAQRAKGQNPEWLNQDGSNVDAGRPQSRLTNAGAEEYLERNRHGTASKWFGHNASVDAAAAHNPKVTSKEGGEIATRLGKESENWFDHSAGKNYQAPQHSHKMSSPFAQGMLQKSRGDEMNKAMHMEQHEEAQPASRTKPEAKEVADKNIQGMMDKYIQQDKNKDYESARPNPRIRPEGQAAFDRNQGVLSDCMTGYPSTPQSHNQNRIKSEAADNARMHQGTMGSVFKGEPESANRRLGGRGVKPEAERYAERNKGTLTDVMNNYGRMEVTEKKAPRLNSSQAEEIAARNKGNSVASIFGM